MKGLRSRVVRLARQRADLRPLLVPLLRTGSFVPKRELNQALQRFNVDVECVGALDEGLSVWAVNPQSRGFVWTNLDLVGVAGYDHDRPTRTDIPVAIEVKATGKQPVRNLREFLRTTFKRNCTSPEELFSWLGTDEAAKLLASYLSALGYQYRERTFPIEKLEQLFDWIDQREELVDVFVTYRFRGVRDARFEGTVQGSDFLFTGTFTMELDYTAEEGDTSPF